MQKIKVQKEPFISIIIPLYVIVDRFYTDLEIFSKLQYKNFEILIVHDSKAVFTKNSWKKIKYISTRKLRTGPAEKRDVALKYAKGVICAFIDDDAYPDPLWLKNAVKVFQKDIAAVGGPGLTPPEDTFWEQVTGHVYSSIFCGGAAQYRFIKGKRQKVVDYPAYNLFVRTDALKKVGGYGSHFYGGEDTFLCLKLIKAGFTIIYDPEVVVYHHKRKLFFDYARQIANIGKHRGYFVKKYPATSFHFWYFLPSILLIGFVGSLLASAIYPPFFPYFIAMLALFYLLGVVSVIRRAPFIQALLAGIGIIMTHLVYGQAFIKGLLIKNLVR